MVSYPVKITVLECVKPSKLFDPVPVNTATGEPHVPCPVHRKRTDIHRSWSSNATGGGSS